MFKTIIYSDSDDKKYFTRLEVNSDGSKKILLKLRMILQEYTNLLNNLIEDVIQIRDGHYSILNYANFESYLSNNIYKIGVIDVKISISEFIELLPEEHQKILINWRTTKKKVCFVSNPIILEKIRFIFNFVHRNTEIVSFLELQKNRKKVISLINSSDFTPCLDQENNQIYDIDTLLKKNKYVVRDDIVVIKITDSSANINLLVPKISK